MYVRIIIQKAHNYKINYYECTNYLKQTEAIHRNKHPRPHPRYNRFKSICYGQTARLKFLIKFKHSSPIEQRSL